MKYIEILIGFAIGAISSIILFLFFNDKIDYSANIVDLLILIVTSILSIAIVLLTKKMDTKDIVKNIITKDIEDLCSQYREFSSLLRSYNDEDCTLQQLRTNINFSFHKADLLVDGIKLEIEKSFPKYYKKNEKEFLLITTPYYKWLTGGSIFNDLEGKLPAEFIMQHETELSKTINQLKIIIHTLNTQG